MEKRYRALRVIAVITKVLAWIILVLGVLGGCVYGAFFLLVAGTSIRNSGIAGALCGGIAGVLVTVVLIILAVLFYFLPLYALAEFIDVMLALEENTRSTAEQLKKIAKA